jgi:hypothetical protein
MAQRKIPTRMELAAPIDSELATWAELEERSKRRHAAILVRRLTELRRTNPDDLVRLGLLDRAALIPTR